MILIIIIFYDSTGTDGTLRSLANLTTAAEPRTRASPDDYHYVYDNHLRRLDPRLPRAQPPFPRTEASTSAARRASPAAMPQGGKAAARLLRC